MAIKGKIITDQSTGASVYQGDRRSTGRSTTLWKVDLQSTCRGFFHGICEWKVDLQKTCRGLFHRICDNISAEACFMANVSEKTIYKKNAEACSLLFIHRVKLMKIFHLPVDKIFPSNVMFCTFDTLLQLGWCPCFAAEQSVNWYQKLNCENNW